MKKLLIANRGEIAIRIARTAADMGIETLAVYSSDDAASLHTRMADGAHALNGAGPAAYLDGAQILAAAREHGCDAVHPGYGFLSENAAFARTCAEAGVTFVGPSPETLELFGDKGAARALAERCDVPILAGTQGGVTLAEARVFLEGLGAGGAVMVKAVAGGGGRGMRPVRSADELTGAFERCASEAQAAFGDGALYVEEFLPRARHVEVQIVGDGQVVSHLWDRECSLQRQRQKVVEIAPAATLPLETRERLFEAAVALGRAARYRNLGTVEFLVTGDRVVFIEANPRLQVEHTVTEEVTGLDLVRIQIELARGGSLADLGLTQADIPRPRGVAVQARVNLETMTPDGSAKPSGGVLSAYEPPSGRGVRVDGFGYGGYRTSARFDSLLAKLIVHGPDLPSAVAKTRRALSEFKIVGAATNIGFLQSLLGHPAVAAGEVHTRLIEERMEELAQAPASPQLFFATAAAAAPKRAGAQIDASDPLAVLSHGKAEAAAQEDLEDADGPEGTKPVRAPLQGTVIGLMVQAGDEVREGQPLFVMEAMKMEHVVTAETSGVVRLVAVGEGDTVFEDHALAFIEPADVAGGAVATEEDVDLDHIRPDLAEVLERQRMTLDEARPDAVARRRKTGQRTTRENIDDLCDPGSFTEYGALTVAARRRRNTVDELIAQTPADGMVMGLGAVNGDRFAEDRSRVAVMAYDYTVLAGTQGSHNHDKLDRMSEIAARWRLPTVFFTEGGGGRPGDTEGGGFVRGFEFWGRLSGAVPLVGVSSGRCFAGNAAILGCCDVIIATKDSALGMGGPAMVEGGGLGVFRPEEIGPIKVMQANGTIDVLAQDEADAVRLAKQYLSYFQGPVADWSCADQRLLRRAIPENRLRVYDIRKVIELIADEGSVLELRPKFGLAMVTAFIRIEGRPVGVFANNPQHLGGAIDSDASDKAARFMQLCEAFDIPLLSLSDTPGNMVGPEAEKTGLIRHCSRLFVIGANLTVPLFSVILRKSYGLGAIAMTGGSYQGSMFCVSWPTGEFGGMGLEGSVKLGYRNELAAIEDPAARKAKFDDMVAAAYARGKALSQAMGPALDDVIDPKDTRRWVLSGLKSLPPLPVRTGKKLRWIDSW
ncbi:carbamoyl-phosphate synthase large subunit [Phenylobacterium sp. Root77]|uniref:carboxyl transferase domain-containing protein n=1 Tax=unclassified Phenylobacterium TaxID=2640670 RepID=UPI0006F89538|nr:MULTISPECIES: carboxyl transferase domain-containing protein [unclassified Phenylobacterium]KQW73327.1 carbamoyl-phosphate synthase large subunit [Phenylobacterium sp. Root1277]KQW92547.1 carbamoyl-phosphate synthase large subunit [Phenylobacterium sp. Root1290]KRC40776.1 carbamoyl-phosphate synthase large subunit [Phenylobacterium sp. Root77]